jgi:predicted nucleic acid-binding protein
VNNVLDYQEILDVNFGQASICVDACFILAFLDSNDARGDAVGNVLVKWQQDGIEKIGIPVQVFMEVVHNLMKNSVLKAVKSAAKHQNTIGRGRKILLSHEEKALSQMGFSKALLRFTPKEAVQRILQGKSLAHPVSEIIKDFKRTLPDRRTELTPLYQESVKVINGFIETLTNDFEFKVDILGIDIDSKDAAVSYMSLFQLEIFDAMHLASTYFHSYDYFATLDRDFTHNLYTANLPKILNIA